MHDASADHRRWAIVTPAPRDEADRLARGAGIEPVLIFHKPDIRDGSVRSRSRAGRIDAALLYSAAWERERAPQLLELGLWLTGARDLYRLDARGAVAPISRTRLVVRLARLAVDAPLALVEMAIDIARLRRPLQPQRMAPPSGPGPAVLAIWIAYGAKSVGGSVTHAAGILCGLRKRGIRVGLLAWSPLPSQLAEVADEFEPLPALPARHRLSGDIEALFMNRAVRDGALRLADRLRPSFVYQRHEAFLVAGSQVARELGIPFALEWNNSLAWTRAHWDSPERLGRPLNRVLADLEGRILRSPSTHAIAVSRHAAAMAQDAGGARERIVVVPNGVNFAAVRGAVKGVEPSDGGERLMLGWIGSFGPWHGAETLVRALALLPGHVELVMIGDGRLRDSCASLAATLGVGDRIDWTGALPHEQALRRLAKCHVLVSPHTQLEGTPFFGSPTKLFEYLAIGRPVVASALEQLAEVLTDGHNALLVEPGDAGELARGVERMWALADRGQSLARQGLADAEQVHDWTWRADVIIEHLKLVASTGDPVGAT